MITNVGNTPNDMRVKTIDHIQKQKKSNSIEEIIVVYTCLSILFLSSEMTRLLFLLLHKTETNGMICFSSPCYYLSRKLCCPFMRLTYVNELI